MLQEQVKVQSGQIMIVGAVSFTGDEIAFRSPFKELGHNLTRCMVWEKGNSRRGEKNLQVLFTFCVIRAWKQSERASVVTDGIGLLIGPLLNISKKAKKRQNESKVSASMAS